MSKSDPWKREKIPYAITFQGYNAHEATLLGGWWFFLCLGLVIASGKSLKMLQKDLLCPLLPSCARWGSLVTALHTLAAPPQEIVCKRLAHTNPPFYLALSQLGRAEFTDTQKTLASLLTFTCRKEDSDCLEKKLHPKVRCTIQDGEKRSLDLLRYFLLQAYKAGGAVILHSSWAFVSEHRKSGTRVCISQTCTASLGRQLHVQCVSLLPNIFTYTCPLRSTLTLIERNTPSWPQWLRFSLIRVLSTLTKKDQNS